MRATAVASAFVVGAAAALGLTLPDHGPPAPVGPETATAFQTQVATPVTSAELACPAPGSARFDVGRAVLATAGGQGTGTSGSVVAGPVGGRGRTLAAAALRAGAVRDVATAGGLVVVAGGDLAPGLLAARHDRSAGARADTGCLASRARWWFTGVGAGVDHRSVVHVANLEPGPAVVDVLVLGASAAVDTIGTRGLTLGPGESLRLALVDVAPQSDELTVEVDASRGRVVAAVDDRLRVAGGTGREWASPGAEPATEVLLGGVPGGPGRRTLLLSNPADADARVAVALLTRPGAFVPVGREQVRVPAGGLRSVDLTGDLDGAPAAVRLTSTVPVTGAVRSTVGGDHALAAALAPLVGPAALTTGTGSTTVQLATGDVAPATVEVTAHAADGTKVKRGTLLVPPSGFRSWSVPDRAAYVVVDPGPVGGPDDPQVFAAAVHRRPGVSAEPAMVLPTTTRVPLVRPFLG